MSLKERYPYLATWKRTGWDNKKRRWSLPVLPWPSFPTDQEEDERYIKAAESFFRGEGFSEADVQKILTSRREDPITSHKRLTRERIIPEALATGFYVLKIQGEYFQRKITRAIAADRLTRKFLPPEQGGKKIPDKTMRESLKNAYKEMMECVREIRVRFEIPLSRKLERGWPKYTVSEILEDIPDVLNIFNETELPLLIQRSSVSDACLKVIHQRIKPLFPSPFTERSVRELTLKK